MFGGSKGVMVIGRNFSMTGINSGHHYLPTYQIFMISDNVEFLPPIFMPIGNPRWPPPQDID
jgi:hypothetical protein